MDQGLLIAIRIPNDGDSPALQLQLIDNAPVAGHVDLKLLKPELGSRRGHRREATALMPVPEAAV